MINLITNHYSNTNNACVNENKHATNPGKQHNHFKATYKSTMLEPQQITQIFSPPLKL